MTGAFHRRKVWVIVVQYELYELYDWGKVPELYGTLQWTRNFMELLQMLSFALLDNLSSLYCYDFFLPLSY